VLETLASGSKPAVLTQLVLYTPDSKLEDTTSTKIPSLKPVVIIFCSAVGLVSMFWISVFRAVFGRLLTIRNCH